MSFDLELQLSFPVSVETLFSAWISEQTLLPPTTKLSIEPKSGGHFILEASMGDKTSVMNGRFLQVVSNKTLRYTWEWNHDGEVSEVQVDFAATAQGCTVSLSHTGLGSQESLQQHKMGWEFYAQGLTQLLRGQ